MQILIFYKKKSFIIRNYLSSVVQVMYHMHPLYKYKLSQ